MNEQPATVTYLAVNSRDGGANMKIREGETLPMPRDESSLRFENEYLRLFSPTDPAPPNYVSDSDSLEQPSPLRVVSTKTTYGFSEALVSAD